MKRRDFIKSGIAGSVALASVLRGTHLVGAAPRRSVRLQSYSRAAGRALVIKTNQAAGDSTFGWGSGADIVNGLSASENIVYQPIFLLHDLFSTNRAAGAVNGTLAEPGGTGTTLQKTRTVVDTEGKLTIVDGELVFAGGKASPSYIDPRQNYGACARIAGRALLATFTLPATNKYIRFGWSLTGVDTNAEAIVLFNDGGYVGAFPSAALAITPISYTATTYQVAIPLRSAGAFWLIKGGVYSDWTLFWPSAVGASPNLVPSIFNYSSAAKFSRFAISDLPAPWDATNGPATQYSATPAAGDMITSDPNTIIEHTWPAVTGETYELDVRRVDPDNRWIVRCSQTGSTIKLIERMFGEEKERATAAQTWTNGTSYRIVVICDSETIRVIVDPTLKLYWIAAANNKYATGVKTSHAGTKLAAWPRKFSGADIPTTALDTAIPTYKLRKHLSPVIAKRAGKWDSYATREISIVIDEDGNMVRDGDNKLTSFYWGRPDAISPPAIGIAKSLDGITWTDRLDTPVLSKQASGWASAQVLTASVIKRSSDGLLMMMCEGTDSLGVFTSDDDGATWTDQGEKIDPADYTINGTPTTAAAVPTCIKRSSGGFVCLFEGRVAGNDWQIFGATATDFLGVWTPLNGGLAIMTQTGTGWENLAVANPRMIEDAPGHYTIIYNGLGMATTWQVGLATSTDLIHWDRYGSNPILHAGLFGTDWDGYGTETSFLVKENFPGVLYYQGFSSGAEPQIGMAEFY